MITLKDIRKRGLALAVYYALDAWCSKREAAQEARVQRVLEQLVAEGRIAHAGVSPTGEQMYGPAYLAGLFDIASFRGQ